MDDLLSKEGLRTSKGVFKAERSKIDGLYYLKI